MKTKTIFISGLAVVAAVAYWWHQPKRAAALEQHQPAVILAKTEAPPPIAIPAPETKPPIQPPPTNVPPVAGLPKIAAQSTAPPAPADEPHSDQVARVALSLVGTGDLDAEAYWLGAIYDTNLSDQEREDLMEDLNEEGFADPKHPSADEIPLILNRLALIEEVAPNADDFMLEHLGEAYKDLSNMLAGMPVQ